MCLVRLWAVLALVLVSWSSWQATGGGLCYGYDRTIVAARIESCRGCSLNRLPEVKRFIYEDVPHYAGSGVEFKPIAGAPPELVLLSGPGEEIDRLPLSKLTRLECNELLEHYGFRREVKIEKNSEF